MKKIELWVTPSMSYEYVDFFLDEPKLHEVTGLYIGNRVGELKLNKELGKIKKLKKITITMEDRL